MTIEKPTYQLKLPLDLPEESPAGDSALSVDEIRLRAETARQQLEGGSLWSSPHPGLPPRAREGEQVEGEGSQVPEWFEEYLKLIGGGWPWRVAVYIAWRAMPKPRWPKTQKELAVQVLGLTSDRQFSVWRAKNPAIDAMIEQVRFGMVYDALGDIFQASISVARTHDYKGRGDREMLFKMVGYLSDKIEADINSKGGVDLAKLSFEEKLRLAGLEDPAQIMALKKRLAAGKPEFDNYEDEEDGLDTPGEHGLLDQPEKEEDADTGSDAG